MATKHKKMFAQPKSAAGRLAKTLTLSFYPKHLAVLYQRAKELNVPCSVLVQVLLEVESRDGLIEREITNRSTTAAAVAAPAKE